MREAYIKSIAYYLPEKTYSNDDIQKDFPEWTADKVTSKVGINVRHIAAENETAADMAVKAAEKLFAESKIEKSEIDFVLFCTQSPDYYLPTSACIIQDRLELSTSCGAFDMNLGCSGYSTGFPWQRGLLLLELQRMFFF